MVSFFLLLQFIGIARAAESWPTYLEFHSIKRCRRSTRLFLWRKRAEAAVDYGAKSVPMSTDIFVKIVDMDFILCCYI